MEKTEKKSLLSGIFVMVLSVIAFICIASSGNNGKMPDYTAYADEYTTSSTATTIPTTTVWTTWWTTTKIYSGTPTRTITTTTRRPATTSIGIYNGNIQYLVSENYSYTTNSYTTTVVLTECKKDVSGEIEIPEDINGLSIEEIRSRTFSSCSALDSITLPESVKTINNNAFNANLKKIIIKNPECNIYNHWDTIPDSTVIYGYADSTAQQYAQTFSREFVILDGEPSETVTSSTSTAPTTTTTLTTTSDTTTTKIPATTVWTTARVYSGTPTRTMTTTTRRPATTSIGIYNGNIQYLVSENYSYTTYSYTTTVILTECKKDVSGELEIPEDINGLSIEEIKSRAFSSCSVLDSITLPESVKNINNNAFNANLKKIIIKNPECNIYNHWDTIPDSTVIYGYADSTAQQYAQTFSREFVILDSEPSETFPSSTSTAPPTTTTPAKKFGDIDGNNIIDAVDASLILSYYAYTSTGGTAEFEEFLASGNY